MVVIASPFIRTNRAKRGPWLRQPTLQTQDLWTTGSEMLRHRSPGDLPLLHDLVRLITFNNTFNIQGGGGSAGDSGIDLRRTVTMIADHLENEMNNRLLRAS